MADANDDVGVDILHVAGNAPDHIKRVLSDTRALFANRYPKVIKGTIFAEDMQNRLRVTEVSILQKAEEPNELEGRVVVELEVMDDMLNIQEGIHGGCSAALIEMCTTLALHALVMYTTSKPYSSVSQTMNMIFHSPAALGDKLRLVNTTLTTGSRAHSATTEIWNSTHHRLVASGMQVQMARCDPLINKM